MRPLLLFLTIGIVTISLMMLLWLFPSEVGTLPDGFSSPVVALEFAETPEEVRKMFEADNEVRTKWLLDMRRGHLADSFYLMFYSLFLGLWGWIAARRTGKKWFYAIPLLALAAGASDAAENLQMVALTYLVDQGDMLMELRYLYLFTWLKWGSLAIGLGALSLYLFPQHLLGKVYSLVSAATLILALLAFVERSGANSLMALAITIQFLLLFTIIFVHKETISLKKHT